MRLRTKLSLVINKLFKQNTLLQLPFFWNVNYTQNKTFENLAILMKNLLTQ